MLRIVTVTTLAFITTVSYVIPPGGAAEPTIRVAMFVGAGANASAFRREFANSDDPYITYETVTGDDIASGALRNFDALLVPGGSAAKESQSMGEESRELVRQFVANGGIYMGVCAGAYLASSAAKTDLGMLPLRTVDREHWYRVDDMTKVDVELTPLGMEVFGIDSPNIRVGYENGPIFSRADLQADRNLIPLATFKSEVVGDGGEPGVMLGAPAIILCKYGRGSIIVISPHFEETPGYRLVQLHALRWQFNHRDTAFPAEPTRNKEIVKQSPLTPQRGASPQGEVAKRSDNAPEDANKSSKPDAQTTVNLPEDAKRLAELIFANAKYVQYEHREVNAARQIFIDDNGAMHAETDCSGFVSHVIHRIAPRHYAAVREREPDAPYPQAKVWARFFDDLDLAQPTRGWVALKLRDINHGDLIAWKEGGESANGNTGHVMIADGKPGPVKQIDGYRVVDVPVIDSSSVYHFPVETLPPKAGQNHRDGLGKGCVRILLSTDDEPIGYWEGTYWGEGDRAINKPTRSDLVRFARMVHLEDQEQQNRR
ncbi:MAG: DJ-1/PfpI family protein [Candidatus Obscuribacterales bacterium]|nr:DJ-1/PfpI family protein [Candidatus Obscuribacterales bacterium]